MASSSSAKKVARVAAKSGASGSGGDSAPSNRNWLFAGTLVVIVAMGLGVLWMASKSYDGPGDNTTAPKANLKDGKPFDHWHAAFAINVCGKELQPLQDGVTDPLGIHTHGDGLIHIHPFTRTAAGKFATLKKYWGQVDLTVTDEGFRLPEGMTTDDGGTTVEEGVTTCGGKEGELVLAHWVDATTAADSEPDKIYRENFPKIRFTEDLGAFTLAFVPKGSTDIPAPSSAADIATQGACDGENPPPACNTATGATPGATPATDIPVETVPPTTAASSDG